MPQDKHHPGASPAIMPAVETNLFHGEAIPNKIKLSFGQQWVHGGNVAWFSAVSLTLSDATQLRDVLDELIAKSEAFIAAKR